MRRVSGRFLAMIALILTLVQGTGSVAAITDTTPPVFRSLSVSSSTIVAGGSVTFTARITDDLAGVETYKRAFPNPS